MSARVAPIVALLLASGCLPTPDVCKPAEIPPIDDTGAPPGGEICDGLDNDADGRVDEGYADINGDNTPDCSPFPELCDEFDNDYDGRVDEGFPDLDGDGIADCFDCPVNTAPAGATPIDSRCGGGVITQDAQFWNPVEEFSWSGYFIGLSQSHDDVHATPMVSPLYDDNRDGVVDGDDLPRIIVQSYVYFNLDPGLRDSAVEVLDYRGGHVNNPFNEFMDDEFAGIGLNQWSPATYLGGLAVADVDVDGSPDIVTMQIDGVIVLLDSGGQVLWSSHDRSGNDLQVGLDMVFNGNLGMDELVDPIQPTVADLDSDGIPEVIAYDLVVDGQTGRMISVLPINTNIQLTMPAIGDIDLDGEQEMIIGNNCFREDGSTCWSAPAPIEGRQGHWNAIVQGDTDPEAEVLMVGNGQIGLFEDDGTQIWRQTVSASHRVASPPCVADFDGDGLSDFAFASDESFNVYHLDGTAMWSMPVSEAGGVDSSSGDTYPPGNAGCSAFDFDNDGSFEILYADQSTFYILRGSDGFELYSLTDHNSDTVFEYPSVADFDGDGSAEIVIGSSNTTDGTQRSGITVLGHPSGGWAHGGPGWQLHDYTGSNVGDAGEIPGASNHYWQDLNLYRARPGIPTEPNLEVQIVDICTEDCSEADSQAFVSLQISNSGTQAVGAGVTVRLYGVNSSGQRIEPYLTQTVTTTPVGSGEAAEGFIIRFPLIDYVNSGAVDLMAVVDPEGAFEECGEDDNSDVWGQDICAP